MTTRLPGRIRGSRDGGILALPKPVADKTPWTGTEALKSVASPEEKDLEMARKKVEDELPAMKYGSSTVTKKI